MVSWTEQIWYQVSSLGAIKGQGVVDFIAEYTYSPEDEARMQEDQLRKTKMIETTWMLYVDDSSTNKFAGGVVLVTLEGTELEYAIQFEFNVTNNKAEYEVLLIELRLARALEVKQVRVNSDS